VQLDRCKPILPSHGDVQKAHPQWDHGQGWKPQLNNLRLLLLPLICTCLVLPWLHLIPLPQLPIGLRELSAVMNTVRSLVPT
jgi:hypothetical protein